MSRWCFQLGCWSWAAGIGFVVNDGGASFGWLPGGWVLVGGGVGHTGGGGFPPLAGTAV